MIIFHRIGIWHNRYYPTSSMISTANRSAAHDLFITGDTDGHLRLFRYSKTLRNYIFGEFHLILKLSASITSNNTYLLNRILT